MFELFELAISTVPKMLQGSTKCHNCRITLLTSLVKNYEAES